MVAEATMARLTQWHAMRLESLLSACVDAGSRTTAATATLDGTSVAKSFVDKGYEQLVDAARAAGLRLEVCVSGGGGDIDVSIFDDSNRLASQELLAVRDLVRARWHAADDSSSEPLALDSVGAVESLVRAAADIIALCGRIQLPTAGAQGDASSSKNSVDADSLREALRQQQQTGNGISAGALQILLGGSAAGPSGCAPTDSTTIAAGSGGDTEGSNAAARRLVERVVGNLVAGNGVVWDDQLPPGAVGFTMHPTTGDAALAVGTMVNSRAQDVDPGRLLCLTLPRVASALLVLFDVLVPQQHYASAGALSDALDNLIVSSGGAEDGRLHQGAFLLLAASISKQRKNMAGGQDAAMPPGMGLMAMMPIGGGGGGSSSAAAMLAAAMPPQPQRARHPLKFPLTMLEQALLAAAPTDAPSTETVADAVTQFAAVRRCTELEGRTTYLEELSKMLRRLPLCHEEVPEEADDDDDDDCAAPV